MNLSLKKIKGLAVQALEHHDDITGECLIAYIRCLRKIREITNAKDPLAIPTPLEILSCATLVEALNNIFLEFYFHILMHDEFVLISNGVFLTTESYDNKKSKNKNKHNKKKGKKSRRKSIGGNLVNDILRLKHIIVVMLLFSLKSITTSAQLQQLSSPAGAAGLKYRKLNPSNETQMSEFARQFGRFEFEPNTNTTLKSENVTNLFISDFLKTNAFKSMFISMNTNNFHDDITERVLSRFNDKMNDVHISMGKVCEKFIETTTIDSPIELTRVFNEELKKRENYLRSELADVEANLRAEIKENVTAEMGIQPPSMAASIIDLFSTPTTTKKPTTGFALQTIDSQSQITMIHNKDEKIKERIDAELPAVLKNYVAEFNQKLVNTMLVKENQQKYIQDRKTFFNNVCEVAIKIPKITYENGVFTFTHFPFSRDLLQLLVENVLVYSNSDTFEESDEDIGKSDKRNKGNEKQIEMAEFLSDVFMKWDTSIINIITRGHHGKKTIADFTHGIEMEFQKLQTFINYGLDGEPNQVRTVKKDLEKAEQEQRLFTIYKDAQGIRQNMTDEQRSDMRNNFGKLTDFVYGISTDWAVTGVNNTRTVLKREVLEIVSLFTYVALTVGGTLLLLCMAISYARRINPIFMPTQTQKRGIRTTRKKKSPPKEIKSPPKEKKSPPEENNGVVAIIPHPNID